MRWIKTWAKADLVQFVDEELLRELRLPDGSYVRGSVSSEILVAIQEGVMRHMGLTTWIEERRLRVVANTEISFAHKIEEDTA